MPPPSPSSPTPSQLDGSLSRSGGEEEHAVEPLVVVVDRHFSVVVCPFPWWFRVFHRAVQKSEKGLLITPEGGTEVWTRSPERAGALPIFGKRV